ncbi:ABC transporter permease subunit [Heliorestis acidaminivorans]|uniref:ABC transporter permease subunit n=1 Tax=Heliorestis acidaminivorans TaxID=553427 RepID=A0A6I0F3G1_9FIRM|nr:ABC transporter permease [Heliorestis acidaminivorans]KAB2952981.1 ABC transporter permease subunit [Heliorestis acidaminivorans]
MELIWQGIKEAFWLFVTFDAEVFGITLRSLQISTLATILALITGVPLGLYLALRKFPGRKFLISLVNTGMAFPPVAIGLWVSIFLWRSGPLGGLELIYTPTALVIAQFVIAFPMITGFTIAGIQQLNPKLHLQIWSLGASRWQYLWAIIRETKLPLIAAVIAGFGAVISEVGASMMVGGNIKDSTRVLTTATVLEVARGNFGRAMALTIILMTIAYVVTLLLTLLQQRERRQ